QYALAAIAATIFANPAMFQIPIAPDEFQPKLHSVDVELRDLITDDDVAKFVDYAVSNHLAEFVQTPHARPRILVNAHAVLAHATNSLPGHPLKFASALGLGWAKESLQNIKMQKTSLRGADEQAFVLDKSRHGGPHDVFLYPVGISPSDRVPASDRYVALDHNQPAYEKAVEELDALIRQVAEERSNSFEEKEGVLGELEAVRTMLARTKINISALKAIGAAIFGYIALRFADAPLGEAAQHVWGLIKGLVGL
ncbi:MAG: hypothetical protein ABL996_03390, partial [Micropepsaceae bacterium]